MMFYSHLVGQIGCKLFLMAVEAGSLPLYKILPYIVTTASCVLINLDPVIPFLEVI